MHPGLPIVAVDFDQVHPLGRQQRDMEVLTNRFDQVARTGRTVVPLLPLLIRTTLNAGHEAIGRLASELVDDGCHVTGVDPDLMRLNGLVVRAFDGPAGIHLVAELLVRNHHGLFDVSVP